MKLKCAVCLLLWATSCLAFSSSAAAQPSADRLLTRFQLASSADVAASGEQISRVGFDTSTFRTVSVPSTVVGALVDDKALPDPYVDMNLRGFPGMDYPVNEQFEGPMREDSPFRRGFWYRAEFTLDRDAGARWYLRLDGLNYRGNVWLNGQRVASADEVVGAFRQHELDLTPFVAKDGRNALALEVFAPGPRDLAFTWVDWNPSPPDKNMGLWGPVALHTSGPLRVRHAHVKSHFEAGDLSRAALSVSAELENASDAPVRGKLRGRIENIAFEAEVALAPHERHVVRFTPDTTPALRIDKPRVWWPYRLGAQELYELTLSAHVNERMSDQTRVRFGIQEMSAELTKSKGRLFKVNGKPLLIRGAAWSSDMLLRPKSRERLLSELRHVREMGLNAIRLEGKFESDLFYDLTDELGILVMSGLCCCDQWERWADWNTENRKVAALSVRDLLRRLRNHPSILVWNNASDRMPPPDVERMYLELARSVEWNKPILASASELDSSITGPTGVKMLGPYDYVPPGYWYLDSSRGGAFGFATEIGPGAAIMPLESLAQTFSPAHLWPRDEVWSYHSGIPPFSSLDEHVRALRARYGESKSLEAFVRHSQTLSYETTRAMFEAYGRNKYEATGVIHWMLNNAWPSLTWHLYDYFLRPSGGYWGAKKACEPLHVQFSYDDRSIVVVNDTRSDYRGVSVNAELLDFGLRSKLQLAQTVDVPADAVVRLWTLPRLKELSRTYFLKLALQSSDGAAHSDNFYWLSTREDELDWLKAHPHHTPLKADADLKQLQRLPRTRLDVRAEQDGRDALRVQVENRGGALAFQVTLQLVDAAGNDVLPAYWEDNQIQLLPRERRALRVSFPGEPKLPLKVRASAWNVVRVEASAPSASSADGKAAPATR